VGDVGVGEASYPQVFSPISIGEVEVSNRFYFSPHGIPLQVGDDPSADAAYYLAERAADGGCGLVMHALRLRPVSRKTIPSFTAVSSMVHEAGAKIFGQLTYSAVGGAGPWEVLAPDRPLLGPSSYQRFDHYASTREMTVDEIKRFVNAYRLGARHLAESGYDGVEIHHTHGMQGEQFLSEYWNRRSDEYGGDLDRRMRLSIEVLNAVREEVGPSLAVGIRFNCDEMLPGGWDQEGARDILARFVEMKLIDFADLDIAVEPHQFPLGMPSYLIPKFSNEGFVAGVREAAGPIPVLSALGRVTSVADAERAISSGVVDLVGAARGLMAEPELVRQAREGRAEESRECIACNLCLQVMRYGGAGCAINPGTHRERRWGVRTFSSPAELKKVVVVGGGAAGAEAARVAAKRGHEVTLFERDTKLGGQLNLWAALPGRDAVAAATRWYESQLRLLGVSIRTGTEATADLVLAEQPDAVVVATGGRYSKTGASGLIPYPIPGHAADFVYTPEQIIAGGVRPTGKVVVLDHEGINTGAGVAELLALNGAQVEIMTRWMQPVEYLFNTHEFAYIVPRLKSLGVEYTMTTHIKEIGDHQVVAFDAFTSEERTVTDLAAVVLATMREPIDGLARELDGRVSQLFTVGDALAPRGLMEATFEAHKFARMIGEEDAPATFAEAYFAEASSDVFPRPASVLLESALV
jgi:2,4-dienoyl-CoA reductase-like NADH-dependent reductase (Old Yellow Enzyme family)